MKINKGDFIELNYTARTADDGSIFDTTEIDSAKEAGIFHDHEEENNKNNHEEYNHEHGHLHKEDLLPAIICVGEKQILPGLDVKIEGLELGKHKILLDESEAFGKKDVKQLKLMPIKLFKDQEIRPFVGLALDIDGSRGVVRSISGGRVIVDFNHPLSGKKVEYDVDVLRVVTDKKEQLGAVLKMLRFPFSSIDVNGEGKDAQAVVNTEIALPVEMVTTLESELSRQVGILVKIHSTEKKVDKKEIVSTKETEVEKKEE